MKIIFILVFYLPLSFQNYTLLLTSYKNNINSVEYEKATNDIGQNDETLLKKYFKKIKIIKIDKSIILGEVSKIDVYDDRFLITDNISQKVYLLNNEGRLVRELTAENCDPGVTLRPINAFFKKDGQILLTNSMPWGFDFDKDGKCLKKLHISFIAPLHLTFMRNGKLVGYYMNLSPPVLRTMGKNGELEKQFGTFPSKFKNLISRFEGGGLVTDKNDNIYQVNVSDTKIYKYDQIGNFINSFESYPSYYRRINNDIASFEKDPSKMIKEIQNIVENKSFIYSLFLLNENLLMLQIHTRGKTGVQIMTTEGKYLLKNELILDTPFRVAKNGFAYRVLQQDMDTRGNISNPIIEKYKYNEN